MKDDSIDGIYDTLKQCALISKSAGGIGVNVHCIRASGSYISGTNGISNGLVPMLRVYNNTGEKSCCSRQSDSLFCHVLNSPILMRKIVHSNSLALFFKVHVPPL